MSLDRIRALVEEDFNAVNTLIINNIQTHVPLIDTLSQHILQSGGKRLRPLLVLLASKACGYDGKEHIPLAAVIEFIHTATLLHDDVVDDSTLRRGRQTANTLWGNKEAILVGDFLFTRAMQLSIDVGNWDIVRIIADALYQISCGEITQLANRHDPHLSTAQYFEVIQAKTALLFAAASRIGGHLGDVNHALQENLYAYGLHLGNAFQLIDDCLDYSSTAEILGKNIGDDLTDGKATLPLIHALQHGTPTQQAQIKQSLVKGTLDYLPEICLALKETKAIEYTHKIAQNEVDKALSCLHNVPESTYKTALQDLAHFALQRNY